jgi:hypothetical protein
VLRGSAFSVVVSVNGVGGSDLIVKLLVTSLIAIAYFHLLVGACGRHSRVGSSSLRNIASTRGVQLGFQKTSVRIAAFIPVATMLVRVAPSVLLVTTAINLAIRVGAMVVILKFVATAARRPKEKITI